MHSYYSHSQIEMYSASAPRGLVQLFMDKQICGTDLEYSLLYRALHKYPPPKKTFLPSNQHKMCHVLKVQITFYCDNN